MSIKSDSQFVIKQVVDTLFASETAEDNDYLKEIKPEDRKRVRKYIREQDENNGMLALFKYIFINQGIQTEEVTFDEKEHAVIQLGKLTGSAIENIDLSKYSNRSPDWQKIDFSKDAICCLTQGNKKDPKDPFVVIYHILEEFGTKDNEVLKLPVDVLEKIDDSLFDDGLFGLVCSVSKAIVATFDNENNGCISQSQAPQPNDRTLYCQLAKDACNAEGISIKALGAYLFLILVMIEKEYYDFLVHYRKNGAGAVNRAILRLFIDYACACTLRVYIHLLRAGYHHEGMEEAFKNKDLVDAIRIVTEDVKRFKDRIVDVVKMDRTMLILLKNYIDGSVVIDYKDEKWISQFVKSNNVKVLERYTTLNSAIGGFVDQAEKNKMLCSLVNRKEC